MAKNSVGIATKPQFWAVSCRASATPKRREAPIAPKGVQLPKIIAAREMKPLPALIPSLNRDRLPRDKVTPPIPAKNPLKITEKYRMRFTFTPTRSEERRVGKECRTRWTPDD